MTTGLSRRQQRDQPLLRVQKETHTTIRALATAEQVPMQEIITKAVELYRRQRILEEANVAYAAMRADPAAAAAFDAEHALFEQALGDGFGDDDSYPV